MGLNTDGIIHEMTHLLLAEMVDSPFARIPSWLNEGLAEYFEQRVSGASGLSNRQQLYLRRAIEAGHWIPLAELNRASFGRMSPEVATLAYVQSLAAVDYLASADGVEDANGS